MVLLKSDAVEMKLPTVFFNCRVLRGYELVRDELWVLDGKIIDPRPRTDKVLKVDCRNKIISPGFIDLQVNGAFGIDFLTCENVTTGLAFVNKKMPSTGVTSYCPTLITSPAEHFHRVLPLIPISAGTANTGAGVIGVHCEGPFISKLKKGAHPIECITDLGSGFKTVEAMYGDLTNVKIVTLACEYPGAEDVIKELTKRGIVVSLGHSVADLETAQNAVKAGARKITHLFNAMPAFHHRDPSLPGLLCSPVPGGEQVYFGIIADGVHTHQAALRIAHRMSPEGLVLVTDALGPMGLPCGNYKLGKTDITVSGSPKTAKVTGTDTLSGCVATMSFCIQHFRNVVGCSTGYALAAATLHPAKCMKIDSYKGSLEVGKDADFVILNDDICVQQTYINGELAFDRTKDEIFD